MRGIIWYHTEEKGREFFNIIKQQYDNMGYEHYVMAYGGRGHLPTVFFKKENIYDEDSWTLLSDTYILDEDNPWEKWNYAYIDSEINVDFCNDVIFPSLTRGPFQGWQTY